MFTFKPKTATVVTGIMIELDGDDISHLAFALSELETYRRADPKNQGVITPGYRPWPWLARFRASLSEARNGK